MKKNNTTTTATKQRRQQAAKARRARRLAERAEIIDRQVRRKLQVFARLSKTHEKQIADLQARLKTSEPVATIESVEKELEAERQQRLAEAKAVDAVIAENSALMDDLTRQEINT